MKKIILALAVIALFSSCSKKEKDYVIISPSSSDTTVTYAAHELQSYWKRITGKDLEIRQTASGHAKPVIISVADSMPVLADTLKNLRKDAFLINVTDTAIYLIGNTPKSALYAVYTLLEDYLGCIKFTPAEEYVPHTSKPEIKKSFRVYNPAFDVRIVYAPGQYDKKFRNWYKLYYINELFGKGMYVHTFHKLIPPEKYFDTHPEYFSLYNGRRIPAGQLCLSNPDVIELLKKNLGERIKQDPDKPIWSVSQNDTYMACECDNCKALYKKYGGSETTYSGAYVWMANQIARAYPDKTISTLAYEFTRHAPEHIKPDSNVQIMLCDIEVGRNKPLVAQQGEGSFYQDLADWTQLTHNIYLWDYVVQFRTYLCPFPNFPVLQPNLQLFEKFGVESVFEQGSGKVWSDLIELKQYLLAKLLWNTHYDVDSLVHRFVNAYYGDAAPYILKYYYTMNNEMLKTSDSVRLDIFGQPSMYVNSFLRPELLNYYESLMDSAQQAVSDDSVLLRRVKRTRLSVDFAWVEVAINNNFPQMPAILNTDTGKAINPKVIQLLDNISAYAKTDTTIWVGERKESVDLYREYALRSLHQRLQPNKLKDAKITLLTKPSPKYPVGGAKALNDGLFGPLSFKTNWLGFEGNDFIAVADFGKPTEISHVEMNFLKDHVSWIFLPKEIKVEVSNDGKNYIQVADTTYQEQEEWNHPQSVGFALNFKPVKARYMKVTAISLKTCPKWHNGYGEPSWIFIDEIIVE